MLDHLQGRGVQGTSPGLRIACPLTGCGGTMYRLQAGEVLQRAPRPNRRPVQRECTCDKCGHPQVISVQAPE